MNQASAQALVCQKQSVFDFRTQVKLSQDQKQATLTYPTLYREPKCVAPAHRSTHRPKTMPL